MTWLDFSQRYETTGRKKQDGYSAADFVDMSDDDLQKAETMLLDGAKELDTSAFQGLAILKSEKGRELLQKILEDTPAPSTVHLCAARALYDITDDEGYLDELLKDIQSEDRTIYEHAVVTLAGAKPSEYQFEVMRFVITDSTEVSLARSEAAGALIRYYGFPPFSEDKTPERRLLEAKMFRANARDIDLVIEEVKAEAAKRGYPEPIHS